MTQPLMLNRVVWFGDSEPGVQMEDGLFVDFEKAKLIAEKQIGKKRGVLFIDGVKIDEYQLNNDGDYKLVSQWTCREDDCVRWEWSAIKIP